MSLRGPLSPGRPDPNRSLTRDSIESIGFHDAGGIEILDAFGSIGSLDGFDSAPLLESFVGVDLLVQSQVLHVLASL